MSSPLRSLVEYEHFVHTLMQQFPAVRRSTVIFVRRGATLARIAGELQFDLVLRDVCGTLLHYSLYSRPPARC